MHYITFASKKCKCFIFILFICAGGVLILLGDGRVPTTTPLCAANVEAAQVLNKVKEITNCKDNYARYNCSRKGEYLVMYNYAVASKQFRCEESVTYATQADYTFSDNLKPLVERWRGPISIAMYAPGTDFSSTIASIVYLRSCTPLISEYVSFHVYYEMKHAPIEKIPSHDDLMKMTYNCSLSAPFYNVNRQEMYSKENKLFYPINVGRNIARAMAETHFVLSSDIELYPSTNIIPQFLEMVVRCREFIQRHKPAVYVLNVFEVKAGLDAPYNKKELQQLLKKGSAVRFHQDICSQCHAIPNGKKWKLAGEAPQMKIFEIAKRMGGLHHWEPIYIGTNGEPEFDERLSWEGMGDKIVQAYAMCLMDYSFLVLNNAFLVHKRGIKKKDTHKEEWRQAAVQHNINLINSFIIPQLQKKYGTRLGCKP